MIISDKQELRRCVKQLVRRADVCEALLDFDVMAGEIGVEPMLDLWARPAASPGEALRRSTAEQTPFSPDAAAMFAALDAMDFPVKDLDRAEEMLREYTRPAYLRELLDTMRAKCVLVRVPMDKAAGIAYEDERYESLLAVDPCQFAAGRYGVDYAAAAARIADAAQSCGARNILMDRFDAQALRYCLLPLCQDQGFALHVHLDSIEAVDSFVLMLDGFEGVRALASAPEEIEMRLVRAAVQRIRLLVLLGDPAHIPQALSLLGTRFVAFAAKARQPEQMLGSWILKKESIWQMLCEAYLPLARTGYELESAAVERDVRRILSGNLLALCRPQGA